jgi:hypothetical protein
MAPERIIETLDKAARRGKLAGFRVLGPGEGGLFTVEAWGTPFEGELIASVEGGPEARDAGAANAFTRLAFRTRMLPRWPWVFGVVLVLSVWPGVVLTQSVLSMMVPGWGWLWRTTWYWYLPLSIVGGVWGWVVAMKRSRVTMAASGREMAGKIAGLLGARLG